MRLKYRTQIMLIIKMCFNFILRPSILKIGEATALRLFSPICQVVQLYITTTIAFFLSYFFSYAPWFYDCFFFLLKLGNPFPCFDLLVYVLELTIGRSFITILNKNLLSSCYFVAYFFLKFFPFLLVVINLEIQQLYMYYLKYQYFINKEKVLEYLP